jgi:hypothetical protein
MILSFYLKTSLHCCDNVCLSNKKFTYLLTSDNFFHYKAIIERSTIYEKL